MRFGEPHPFPKVPEWARRGNEVSKGDLVEPGRIRSSNACSCVSSNIANLRHARYLWKLCNVKIHEAKSTASQCKNTDPSDYVTRITIHLSLKVKK